MIFNDEDIRKMRVWAERRMYPHAAAHTAGELRTGAHDAHDRFRSTFLGLPEDRLAVRPAPEIMPPRDIMAHVTLVLGWNDQKFREILTGAPSDDAVIETFFDGAGDRSTAEIVATFDRAWAKLADTMASISDDSAGTSPHPLFGPINGREWLTAVADHFDNHRQQMLLHAA